MSIDHLASMTSGLFQSTYAGVLLDEPYTIQDSFNCPQWPPAPDITKMQESGSNNVPHPLPPKHKCGWPQLVKEAVLGAIWPWGWPWKQAMDVENNGSLYKWPVGWPPKEKAMWGVQIELGTFVSSIFFLLNMSHWIVEFSWDHLSKHSLAC